VRRRRWNGVQRRELLCLAPRAGETFPMGAAERTDAFAYGEPKEQPSISSTSPRFDSTSSR